MIISPVRLHECFRNNWFVLTSAELTIICLGSVPQWGICFSYDGASLHRACWMAMVVYTLTIHLLGNQFHHSAWERRLVSTTLCSLLSDMFSLPCSASYIKYFALVTCTMFSKNVLVRGTINQSRTSINFETCLLSYLASHNPSFQNVNNIRLVCLQKSYLAFSNQDTETEYHMENSQINQLC